jgi:hypothetical protein
LQLCWQVRRKGRGSGLWREAGRVAVWVRLARLGASLTSRVGGEYRVTASEASRSNLALIRFTIPARVNLHIDALVRSGLLRPEAGVSAHL